MTNALGYTAKDVAARAKNTVALSMLKQHEESLLMLESKSPRLTQRALHTRSDVTSVSPGLMRRHVVSS